MLRPCRSPCCEASHLHCPALSLRPSHGCSIPPCVSRPPRLLSIRETGRKDRGPLSPAPDASPRAVRVRSGVLQAVSSPRNRAKAGLGNGPPCRLANPGGPVSDPLERIMNLVQQQAFPFQQTDREFLFPRVGGRFGRAAHPGMPSLLARLTAARCLLAKRSEVSQELSPLGQKGLTKLLQFGGGESMPARKPRPRAATRWAGVTSEPVAGMHCPLARSHVVTLRPRKARPPTSTPAATHRHASCAGASAFGRTCF